MHTALIVKNFVFGKIGFLKFLKLLKFINKTVFTVYRSMYMRLVKRNRQIYLP